jgi:hypothetical protein
MKTDHYPYATDSFDSFSIGAGNSTLLRQAPMTADVYMKCAVHDINELFGLGYARAHPELVAAYMQTAAMDMGAAVIARAIELGKVEP